MPAQPTVLIMAAGHGTRMRSTLAKVLHPVCGQPMLHWVIAAAREAGAGRTVCVTRAGDGVAEALPDGVESAEQVDGEGTGAAVLAARANVEAGSTVVILSGDVPLIAPGLIAGLIAAHDAAAAAATLLTTDQLDPAGYGRIVRTPENLVERIVETKDPSTVPPDELAIREVNIGAYAFDGDALFEALDAVGETGGERYLTGVFPILRDRGGMVAAHLTLDTLSAMGVNTRVGLMEVERHAQRRIVEAHALAGVSFTNPASTVVDIGVEIGEDTRIGPGVSLRGATRIGARCEVGPHTTITDSTLGNEVTVPHSYLLEATVEDQASVGPFAYLRPAASIGAGAKIGTFVEVKNTRMGEGAKAPHLSYLGDADIGDGANLGAGTITANYDGRNKHRTTIGRSAKTGVHTALVAPVDVGAEAYTGAGSVITEDVPDGALGISRPEQKNVEGYAQRAREEPAG